MPAVPPIGHFLRAALPERWLRIHNLPNSQRYPTNDQERAIVLYRNNVVASTVIGIGSPCTAYYREVGPTVRATLPDQPSWDVDEDGVEELERTGFRPSQFVWRPGMLDDDILARAMDETAGFAVISHATAGVYCPYDGGMDLILPTAEDVEPLRQLFKAWLSKHPLGL
jgi:hypothetical protein